MNEHVVTRVVRGARVLSTHGRHGNGRDRAGRFDRAPRAYGQMPPAIDPQKIYLPAIACAVALIVMAIFPWRGFDPGGHWHRVGWIPFVSRPVRAIDIIGNVLLFVPLGVSVSLYAGRAALL